MSDDVADIESKMKDIEDHLRALVPADAELEFLESAEKCCDHAASYLIRSSAQYLLDHPELLHAGAEPHVWFDGWCERRGITEAVKLLRNAANEALRQRLEQIGLRIAARRGKVQ